MNRKVLIEKDVANLLGCDEDHLSDRKALMVNGNTLEKIAFTFANSDGSEIFVRIADTSEKPIPDKRWNGGYKIQDFNGHPPGSN